MTSPDNLALLLASGLSVAGALFARYRYHASERRARADQAEDDRLMSWVQDLHEAGATQSLDPDIAEAIRLYAESHKPGGRHRASHARHATMALRA